MLAIYKDKILDSDAFGYFLFGMILFDPVIADTIIDSFRCHKYDNGDAGYIYFLKASMRINCQSKSHLAFRYYAAVQAAVYIVGFPLMLFIALRIFLVEHGLMGQSRSRLETHRDTNHNLYDSPIPSLTKPYRPEWFFYEVYVLLRRIVLTSVVFLLDRSQNQMIIVILLLSTLVVVAEREAMPYVSRATSGFAYLIQWQVVLYVQVLLMLDGGIVDNGDMTVGILLLVSNIWIIFCIWFVGRDRADRSDSVPFEDVSGFVERSIMMPLRKASSRLPNRPSLGSMNSTFGDNEGRDERTPEPGGMQREEVDSPVLEMAEF